MKTNAVTRIALLIAFIIQAHAFSWASESSVLDSLKFIGVLVSAGETHVVVVDSSTGRSSGWTRVGGNFGHCSIDRYDTSSQMLFVSKDGVSRGLPLVEAKTLSSGASLPFRKSTVQIFADSAECSNGRMTFSGNVTVFGSNLRASAARAIFDPGLGTLQLDGNVSLQSGTALIKGEHVNLKSGGEREAPSAPQPKPPSQPPSAEPGRS